MMATVSGYGITRNSRWMTNSCRWEDLVLMGEFLPGVFRTFDWVFSSDI